MKQEKIKQKLISLVEKNEENTFSLLMKDKKIMLSGVFKDTVELQNAIVIFQCENKKYIKGQYDGRYIEYSSIINDDLAIPIVVGVDYSDFNNKKVYLAIEDEFHRINSSTQLQANDGAVIFWAYGNNISITTCILNSSTNETEIEIITLENNLGKNMIKAYIQKIITEDPISFNSSINLNDNNTTNRSLFPLWE